MDMLRQLRDLYEHVDYRDLSNRQLDHLWDGLKNVSPEEISSSEDGKAYIELLRKFRESIAENDKRHGTNYPGLLKSVLSVGEDGLYSNNLRFIFELIQNVDDCDYNSPDDCKLDMHFDFNNNEIVLTYNEVGFTPFNVFAITGIAEAAKNISSSKNEIGEKGIGFKSVFGVAHEVLIRSGWFSFELHKDNFTIPVPAYRSSEYWSGTQMTLYVPGQAKKIYGEIKNQYCREDALFSRNPLLFLNKLTSLKLYSDDKRSMEFHVSRSMVSDQNSVHIERNVEVSVYLHDYENGVEKDIKKQFIGSRYLSSAIFSRKACQSRYGEHTQVGDPCGKTMSLQVVVPNLEYISEVGNGSLYSFLPTQLKLTVPIVCHVPFKLDASREFVDPQEENAWFQDACAHMSELIDLMYMDWRSVVKERIVLYIPGARESLFAPNNGKEQCLCRQDSFQGAHYLKMPLFHTIDGTFQKADEISCFAQEEQISDPERVYRIMGYQSKLFVPSDPVQKFEFNTIRGVKDRLFMRALYFPDVTSDALDYLDSVDYSYSEKFITNRDLSFDQIKIIFKHPRFLNIIRRINCRNVMGYTRPLFSIKNADEQKLSEVLYEDFDLRETPRQVENYIKDCQEKCVCLDIEEDNFLPCSNIIILSQKNALSSLAAFCRAIDPKDALTVRIGLREASNRLNHYVEEGTGTASDFLRFLSNIRRSIKDALGQEGYKRYIELIQKSGTDKGRYIFELLQNADDCDYPPNVVPSFSLKQDGNNVFLRYNEVGFSRSNIRSLTAIGESTKNKLIDGQYGTIGEKGVGFKTVFSIASRVLIQSGEYAFSLTDREPTIPKPAEVKEESAFQGTRMIMVLKDQSSFRQLSDKAVLEMCLCLRKLRSLQIGNHKVSIEEVNGKRTITVDDKQYVFRRFVHNFTVTNTAALEERSNETRTVSSEQTITCFVPERGGLSEYALYNGLPTKHKIKIPLVIDAPFVLTTSREEILTGDSPWNSTIRKELYAAIMRIIDVLKVEERENVFRFTNFNPHLSGSVQNYHNEISDSEYINSFDYLNALKGCMILPTFDVNVFAIPLRKASYRFPEAANILFRSVPQSDFAGIRPASIIDVKITDRNKKALNALECKEASFGQVFPIIEKHAERFIYQDDFRSKLYEFLQESPPEYRERIKQLPIIPVYEDTANHVRYIHWVNDRIFVKKNTVTSGADYYVLNENLLPKSVCESIFGTNINEMNEEWERSRYNDRLKNIIRTYDTEKLYHFLLTEFQSGAFQNNDSFAILNADSGMLPLKNELGDIVTTTLYVCNQPSGYFSTELIQQMIVHKECAGFANFLRFDNLCGIHYDDINYHQALTADDIEMLQDSYFLNSEEILRGFYRDGLISDLLLDQYKLGYLAFGREDDSSESYEFPSDPVSNFFALRNHVQKQLQNPVRIISVDETRSVRKGLGKDGSTFELRSEDIREGALKTYAPEGSPKKCFCQMCLKAKDQKLIEVNNIELEPDYYFPELRIALCLECSKRFESYRNTDHIRTGYLVEIKNPPRSTQGTVDIHIKDSCFIRFTTKHLAEIQEILRWMPSR